MDHSPDDCFDFHLASRGGIGLSEKSPHGPSPGGVPLPSMASSHDSPRSSYQQSERTEGFLTPDLGKTQHLRPVYKDSDSSDGSEGI